jgi:hypothetical protein
MPRRMVLDMVLCDRGLKATARVYGMGWPRAKVMLSDALDLWADIYERVSKDIDERDVAASHARLTHCAR